MVTFFSYLLSCRLSQCSNFGGITPKKSCRTTLRGLLRIARKQFSSPYWLLLFFFFRHLIKTYIQFIRLIISSSFCEWNTDDIRSNSPSVVVKGEFGIKLLHQYIHRGNQYNLSVIDFSGNADY